MIFKIFSSGSAGNSSVLKCENCNILIDAGITQKSIELNLNEMGLSLHDINYLFITHEHDDHIRAFPMLLKYEQMTIYLTYGTYLGIKDKLERLGKVKQCQMLEDRIKNGGVILLQKKPSSLYYDDLNLDGVDIKILPTFHDANEPVGFMFKEHDKKFVYLTDTGYIHKSLYDFITNADCYMLECNHDPSILMHSSRPFVLKQRILSEHGHLSNEDSMVALVNLIGDKTKLIFHAHISEECNLSQIIIETRNNVFEEYGIDASNIEFVITAPRATKEYNI